MPILNGPAAIGKRAASFELIAGHPALDLVNTLDWRFRDPIPEELLESYGDLLRFSEQSGLLIRGQARRLLTAANGSSAARVLALTRELREAAAAVFYGLLDEGTVSAAALRSLEGFFKTAREHRKLSGSGSSLEWVWPRTEAADLPFWQLSLSVEALTTSAAMQRVRACGNPECRWLFLDTSKNHTRRWCEMKICGNRMKARRFKAQHRG